MSPMTSTAPTAACRCRAVRNAVFSAWPICPSTLRVDERTDSAEQRELAISRVRQVAVEIGVRRIRGKRAAALIDRAIDRVQVVLQDADGFRIQLVAPRLE